MTSSYDPTLGLNPSVPFVYGERPKNQWRMLPVNKDHPTWQDHELIIADLGGGLNKVWGDIFPHYLGVDLGDSNRTSNSNSIDVSYPGQAILTTFFNTETVCEINSVFYSQTYIYGNLFIAGGSTANKSLYKENAATGGLAAVTFSPGGAITCLYNGFFSGAPIMTIGMIGTQAKTLASDLSTTVTMASSNTLWGGILSPLNASTPGIPNNLLMISTGSGTLAGIYSISGDQAASANLVDSNTRFNYGGYAVGIANVATTPGSLVPRAVWVIPQTGAVNGVMGGINPHCDIYHTNLYGTDPQKLITNLPWVSWCLVNEGVLYYTDGYTWMMNDGKEQDLGWNFEREQDSDYKYFSTGGGFPRGQLVVAVCRLNFQTVASSTMWHEKYDTTAKRWFKVSKELSPTTTLVGSDLGIGQIDRQVLNYPAGNLPYSPNSQMLYLIPYGPNVSAKDYFQFIGATGYSHFWNYRYTSGSSKAGFKMEASGTWDSPALSLPWPLKGLPTVITGVGIYGDVLAGGTGGTSVFSTVKFQQATQGSGGSYSYSNNLSHIVSAATGLQYQQRWRDFKPAQWDPFTRLKFRLTLTQDDSRTDWTPNALPIIIRMRTFTDGRVEPGS